jgi:hypothetical protein
MPGSSRSVSNKAASKVNKLLTLIFLLLKGNKLSVKQRRQENRADKWKRIKQSGKFTSSPQVSLQTQGNF